MGDEGVHEDYCGRHYNRPRSLSRSVTATRSLQKRFPKARLSGDF